MRRVLSSGFMWKYNMIRIGLSSVTSERWNTFISRRNLPLSMPTKIKAEMIIQLVVGNGIVSSASQGSSRRKSPICG